MISLVTADESFYDALAALPAVDGSCLPLPSSANDVVVCGSVLRAFPLRLGPKQIRAETKLSFCLFLIGSSK
jgi:hypothetical protein